MYRKNASDEWIVFPYFTKNINNNTNDKRGVITIDTLKLGEYAFAMKDYTMGIQNNTFAGKLQEIKVFPNPTKDLLTVDLVASSIKIPNNALLTITDTSGKIIYKEKLNPLQSTINLKTSTYGSGIYFITIHANDSALAKTKFIVSH